MSNLLKKEKGFTLIEIVLVLAIAGLLLVVVFLAVSGAQKSRRDSQRSSDVAKIAASVETWASNSAGKYPTQAQFNTDYAAGGAYDPKLFDPLTPASQYTTGTTLVKPVSGTAAGLLYTVTGNVYTICIGLENGQKCVTNQ